MVVVGGGRVPEMLVVVVVVVVVVETWRLVVVIGIGIGMMIRSPMMCRTALDPERLLKAMSNRVHNLLLSRLLLPY